MKVAFSGSGLLFPMHLGAYESLRDYDSSELSSLAGTSGGSIVAAALAFYDVATVYDIIRDLDLRQAAKYNPTAVFRKGYSYGRHIEADLKYVFGDKTLGESDVPLYITASDVISGNSFVFNSIDTPEVMVRTAVRASIAVPLLYTPVKYKGMLLVDGGVLESTPIDVFHVDNDHTYGIRIRMRNRNININHLNYLPRVITMLQASVDAANSTIDTLDESTDIFFIETSRKDMFDVEDMVREGRESMRSILPTPFQTL